VIKKEHRRVISTSHKTGIQPLS